MLKIIIITIILIFYLLVFALCKAASKDNEEVHRKIMEWLNKKK